MKTLKEMTHCRVNIEKRPPGFEDLMQQQQQNKQNHRHHHQYQPQDKFFQGVLIEGTRSQIDKCLEMIRQKFVMHPEVTLEQVNAPGSRADGGGGAMGPAAAAVAGGYASPQELLASQTIQEVYISAFETGSKSTS